MGNKLVLTISNNHVKDCGIPPDLKNEGYTGYFENQYGEQMVFKYNRKKGLGTLWCGDARWDSPYTIRRDKPLGIVLNKEETAWFLACWKAATGEEATLHAIKPV